MDSKSVDSLFRVVKQINDREREDSRKKANSSSNRKVNRLFLELVIFPFCLAITIGLTRKFFDLDEWLIEPALAMLALSYIGIFLHFVISMTINRKFLIRGMSNPFYLLVDNAKSRSQVDVNLLHYLESKPIEQLKFLLLEINSENLAFQKRISLIIGAIEKIGLIPGFLATAVTLSKLDSGHPEWVYALAYATPALHIFGVAMHHIIFRFERISSLLEYVIETKESSPTNQPTTRLATPDSVRATSAGGYRC